MRRLLGNALAAGGAGVKRVLPLIFGRETPAREVTLEDVAAEAERGGYRLIDLAELRERYETAPEALLLVDTREEGEFRAGHIRKARLFPMKPTWWARFRSAGKMEKFLGPDREKNIGFY